MTTVKLELTPEQLAYLAASSMFGAAWVANDMMRGHMIDRELRPTLVALGPGGVTELAEQLRASHPLVDAMVDRINNGDPPPLGAGYDPATDDPRKAGRNVWGGR